MTVAPSSFALTGNSSQPLAPTPTTTVPEICEIAIRPNFGPSQVPNGGGNWYFGATYYAVSSF